MSARQDFVIQKRAKFYKELDLTDDLGAPIDLTHKTIRARIKESYATSQFLHDLTVANGGIVVLDSLNGKVALYISAEDTDVDADFGVYDVVEVDNVNYTSDIERFLEGRVEYSKGVS